MKVVEKNIEEDEQKAQPKDTVIINVPNVDEKDTVVIIVGPLPEDKDTAAVKVDTTVVDTTRSE